MLEHDLAALSDQAKDQYFLTNPAKLQFILDAADVREADRVIEIGAGAGTVARVLPRCRDLTLVEVDERLIPTLRRNAPDYATIINGDGLSILRQSKVDFDVVLGNLPSDLSADLAALLTEIRFRIAVIASGATNLFERFQHQIEYSVLTSIGGADFTPAQPGTSYLISACRRSSKN